MSRRQMTMSKEPTEPTLTEQTKKIFKDTVSIYRKDLDAMIKNPLPLVLVIIATIILLLLISAL